MKTFRLIPILTLAAALAMAGTPTYAGMGGRSGSGGTRGMKGDNNHEKFRATPTYTRISTGSMDADGVKLDLHPVGYKDGVFKVRFYANTHTGNLADYNLMERAHIEIMGEKYWPTAMDRMRGHHSSGIIEFTLSEMPSRFTIVIRGIPNTDERVFQW